MDDRYTLIELLGSGGMAQVYLAHDEVLDRDVALKILRHQYAEDEEFVERFRREARNAAGLSHPNIVSVYDQGRSEDGAYYIAMEYVPGGTLKDRIRRDGALGPNAAAGVALQIADALQAAHEKGVIHRDIKSQNVLVTRTGDVKVTDFGIARAASSPVTATGVVLGTAGYMSPEQAMGKPVGPRSDLYSLGVVLYEMLTGELPYNAESPVAQAMKHVNEPPRSPREVNPDVPEALEALTANLLAKNPEDRYTGAAGLIDDLERVRSGLPPAAAKETERMAASLPPSPGGQTKRTAAQPPVTVPVEAPERGGRRRGKLFPALAALLLVLALLGGLALVATQRDSGAPQSGGSKDTSGVKQAEAPGVAVPAQSISPPGDVGGGVPGGNVSGSGASDGGAPSGVASGDGVSGGGAASPSQAVPGASAAPAQQQQQQQQKKQQQPLRKGGEDKGGED